MEEGWRSNGDEEKGGAGIVGVKNVANEKDQLKVGGGGCEEY